MQGMATFGKESSTALSTQTAIRWRCSVILVEGTRGFDVTDQLSKIRHPALTTDDSEDGVMDADATMEIAEKLEHQADFRLYLYAGFGHAAYDNAPDYRERLLRLFREHLP